MRKIMAFEIEACAVGLNTPLIRNYKEDRVLERRDAPQ
jgi:hypothetical protein